jgi:hypothetical protein
MSSAIVRSVKCHVLAVMTATLVFASGVVASSSTRDQRLADALVVRKADGPAYWLEWKPKGGALFGCVANAPAGTADSRSAVGGPSTGVDSLATVFPDHRQAHLYYRRVLAAVARCVRTWIAGGHPNYVWDAQPLGVGRYGRQSGAWRLRYIDGAQRKSLDWALVDIGKAVLIDVFSIAWYDNQWQDTGVGGALGGTALAVERRILTNAARRAAVATSSR